MKLPVIALAAFVVLLCPELRVGDAGAEGSLRGVSSLHFPAAQARSSRAAWPGPFAAELVAVKDGDTLEVRFTEGPCGRAPCPGQELAIRVLGIDAPEAHKCGKKIWQRSKGMSCAACPRELALGRKARAFTAAFVEGLPLRISAARADKYGGRLVATVEARHGDAWDNLADALLEADLAVPYDGGRKTKPWCD